MMGNWCETGEANVEVSTEDLLAYLLRVLQWGFQDAYFPGRKAEFFYSE